MKRLTPLFLASLALLLAFAPAAQDEQAKLIKQIQDKTNALTKASKDFDSACKSKVEPALFEIIDDWHYGWDPAKFHPHRDKALESYTQAQENVTKVVKAKPTYDEMVETAKTKKWSDIPKVKAALNPCKTALQQAQQRTSAAIKKCTVGKIAEHWTQLEYRDASAGKGNAGEGDSGTKVTVSDDPHDPGTRIAENTVFYRVWGAGQYELGAFWTTDRPSSAKDARTAYALPDTSYCEKVTSVRFKKGAVLIRSTCSKLYGQPGGGEQYKFKQDLNDGKYADKWVQDNLGCSALPNK